MKNVIKNIFGILFSVILLTGCNSDLEKRVSSLERRMVELENRSQAQNTNQPQISQPVSTSAAEPETKPDGPLPEFTFAETAFDFGQIKEGDVVSHTFNFTNTGDAPLIIQNATASCGCTVPSYPKQPVAPGGTGEIVVEFNSARNPGVQNKTVTITANTYPSQSKLNIKSVVAAAANNATDGPVR